MTSMHAVLLWIRNATNTRTGLCRSSLAVGTVLAMLAAIVLPACGANSKGATDTNTNWLKPCDEDAECGSELACLCGRCTVTCDADEECEAFDEASSCSLSSECGRRTLCSASGSTGDDPEGSATDDSVTEPEPREPGDSGIIEDSQAIDGPPRPDPGPSGEPPVIPDDGEPGVTPDGGAPDELLCGRPRAEYDYVGEGCPLDFDCWSFENDCGCGCLPAECQTGDRQYVGTSEQECAVVSVGCSAPQEPFSDECGCGCVTPMQPMPSDDSCDTLADELRAEWMNVATCTSTDQCEAQYNRICGAQSPTLEMVGCSLPVNREASQERLMELESTAADCQLFAADCDCGPPPPASCVDGFCQALDDLDDEALCAATGGEWDPGSCGHYSCGFAPECAAIIPGCDCGPLQNFRSGSGCTTDPDCGLD